jgi:hypothetical protein
MPRGSSKISPRRSRKREREDAQVFRVMSREAVEVHRSPTGDVGLLYSGEGIEAVWVSKDAEKIDRRWFRYEHVDLITVLRGRLKVEFPKGTTPARVLDPGDVLVLPSGTRCRAYRWPRSEVAPTVFLAVYRTTRGPSSTRHAR